MNGEREVEDSDEECEEVEIPELSKIDQLLLREEQEKFLKTARALYGLEKKIERSSGLQKIWLSTFVKPQIEAISINENLEKLEEFAYHIKWIVWVLCVFAFLGILVYFTVSGVTTDQRKKYLSLEFESVASGDSGSDYRLCLQVPLSVTGQWTIDSNGFWSGKSKFKDGLGVYSVQLNGFTKSIEEYKLFILELKEQIDMVAASSINNDIATNLAIWTNWGYAVEDGDNTHVIRFSGQPSYVFDRFYKSAAMVDPKNQCFAVPSVSLDKTTGNFVVQWLYDEYTQLATQQLLKYPTSAQQTQLGCCFWDPTKPGTCPSGGACKEDNSMCMLPAVGFGYNPAFDSSHFSLRYNINSLMTAFAVNMGLVPYEILSEAHGDFMTERGCIRLTDTSNTMQTYHQDTPFLTWSEVDGCIMHYNNTKTQKVDKYTIELRIDDKFANMDPIYCLNRISSSGTPESYPFTRMCMLRAGDTFTYPHFNHVGTSGSPDNNNGRNFYNFSQGCSCSPVEAIDPAGQFYTVGNHGSDPYCDRFDLMHGFVIINSKYADVIFSKLLTMAMNQSAVNINRAAYFPSFAAVRTGGNAGQNKQTIPGYASFDDITKALNAPLDAKSPFYFCQDLTNGCVVFAMNTYDMYDQRINKQFYDLANANCYDSFSIANESWFNTSTGVYYVPPQQLIQDYYECYNQVYISLMASFGSAAGAAETLSSVWAFTLVYAVLFGCGGKNKDTVKKNQVEVEVEVEEFNENDVEMLPVLAE